MIVVDTNVVSELMRPSPSPAVATWLRAEDEDSMYTTSITVAEVRYGIERLAQGRRKEALRTAANGVFLQFAEQILAFDVPAAHQYATLVCNRENAGLPINGFDAQIAAICRCFDATLATRNGQDFQGTDVDVVDPWRFDGTA